MSAPTVKISDPGSGLFPGPGTFPGPSTFPSAGMFVAYLCLQLQGSLTIGKRSTANFTLKTPLGVHFQQFQQVQVFDGSGTLVFSGYIGQPVETKPGHQNSLLHQITCIDQHWLADKRRVAKSYSNQPYDAIAHDLYKTILIAEGVTVGQIGSGPYPGVYPGPALFPSGAVLIPSATFVYCTVAQALDALVQQASTQGILYYWQIDELKKLWVVPYGAVVNSTVVDGTQIDQVNNPPQVARQNPTYHNTQYVLSKVLQTSLKEETQPGDGQKRTWAMGYDLAAAPAIFVNNTKQSVGIKGQDTGRQFYWQAGSPMITQDQGLNVLSSSDVLGVYYYGQYEGAIPARNQAEIEAQAALDGTTGIVEDVLRDDTITLRADGLAEGEQLLARYALRGKQLQFTTRQTGFVPGQMIPVNLPVFDLASTSMLIESVDFSYQLDGLNLWLTVRAIIGPYDVSWQDYEAKALALPQPANSINVGV